MSRSTPNHRLSEDEESLSSENPLLRQGNTTTPEKGQGDTIKRRTGGAMSAFAPHIFLHAILICSYTILFFIAVRLVAEGSKQGPELVYSPAREAVEYQRVTFQGHLDAQNVYKGRPRPEFEKAWNRLLAPTAIRISNDTLSKINKTSIEILDGSGYFGTLDVYHQLHCLYRVRQAVYRDHYNLSEPNMEQHVDHCLDMIRQHVMCHADITVNTYEWIPNYKRPWPAFSSTHQCVNWDKLHSWTYKHAFNGFDKKLISHPNYNPNLPSPFSYTEE